MGDRLATIGNGRKVGAAVSLSVRELGTHRANRFTSGCAKTAKPLEIQFGMLSRVGSGNIFYTGRATFGCLVN